MKMSGKIEGLELGGEIQTGSISAESIEKVGQSIVAVLAAFVDAVGKLADAIGQNAAPTAIDARHSGQKEVAAALNAAAKASSDDKLAEQRRSGYKLGIAHALALAEGRAAGDYGKLIAKYLKEAGFSDGENVVSVSDRLSMIRSCAKSRRLGWIEGYRVARADSWEVNLVGVRESTVERWNDPLLKAPGLVIDYRGPEDDAPAVVSPADVAPAGAA